MSESNARYLPALLGAGVSIFVGLSVLMGRIYFQKYAEILGILESDFRLTAIDYALFSPDVTIVALGMAALTAACLWGLIWSHDRISWNGRYIIGGGAVVAVIGFGSLVSLTFVPPPEFVQELFPGAWGLAWVLLFGVTLYGGVLAFASFLENPKVKGQHLSASSGSRNTANDGWIWLGLPLVSFVLPTIIFVGVVSLQVSTMAKVDAEHNMENARPAEVIVTTSGEAVPFVHGSDGSDGVEPTGVFRVILRGDNFVYLRPAYVEVSSSDWGCVSNRGEGLEVFSVHAVPKEQIARIAIINAKNCTEKDESQPASDKQ